MVFTIEVADTGHGIGLTPPVAGAVPEGSAWQWTKSTAAEQISGNAVSNDQNLWMALGLVT